MKYTEVIPAMQKCAAGPMAEFFRLLSRLVYGAEFEDAEREGRQEASSRLGTAISKIPEAVSEAGKAAAPAASASNNMADSSYTNFKAQYNKNN